MDVLDMIKYENGQLNDIETLVMFSKGIKEGSVWSFQGHYGRTANALIEDGFINKKGVLTPKAIDFIELNS